MDELSAQGGTPFAWADTPWMVAALLGAWGVFMGVEEFFLANVFMVLAGVSCTARLARDCFEHRRRRWVPFGIWLAIVVTIVAVDIHLTEKKKASSEAKEGEITRLTGQVANLNGTIQRQSIALSEAQGHTDQHVSDIQEENRQLRASIDKKDAALVSIAKQQYSLNFSPQVLASVITTSDEVRILNNGKTNVEVYDFRIENAGINMEGAPSALLVAGLSTGFKISEMVKNIILLRASRDESTGKDRTSLECSVSISTQDHKRYLLPYTWVFVVKDGAIASSFAIDRPITKLN
jgi:hypothetical protein